MANSVQTVIQIVKKTRRMTGVDKGGCFGSRETSHDMTVAAPATSATRNVSANPHVIRCGFISDSQKNTSRPI